jgi:hypothetical protein
MKAHLGLVGVFAGWTFCLGALDETSRADERGAAQESAASEAGPFALDDSARDLAFPGAIRIGGAK